MGNTNGNVGTFAKSNVAIGSELVLTLKQTRSGSKILSSGAEVGTTRRFTYGTFEFTSRVVNVASGSVASGFLYATNSVTEIDMEQVGNKPNAVDCTNWKGLSNFQDTQVTGYNQGNTHSFKIVWRPTYVNWYVDGKLVVSHTRAVPSAPAPFLFNMWGTNSSKLGRHSHHGNDTIHVHQQLQVHTVTADAEPEGWGVRETRPWVACFSRAQRCLLVPTSPAARPRPIHPRSSWDGVINAVPRCGHYHFEVRRPFFSRIPAAIPGHSSALFAPRKAFPRALKYQDGHTITKSPFH